MRSFLLSRRQFAIAILLAGLAPLGLTLLPAQGTVTVQLQDYAAVPQSGVLASSTGNASYVARVNFLREEPGPSANRFFVNDLNGRLYLLNKTTREFTSYLDFQRNLIEAPAATGLFGAFTRANGYANGLVTFQFDPEYAVPGSPHHGKFYTVHIELDTNDGDARRLPNASSFPGYSNAAAYAPTTANEAPGNDNANTRHAVLIEWQDTTPTDSVFQGTARELMRIEFNSRIHPLGDLLFNPLATSAAHPDWRNLYLAVGDGGAGEQNNATLHPTPQRLDVLQGKILRIHPDDPDGPGPLRYGIPLDNPFSASIGGTLRGEIWAYGLRNPHRLSWDPTTNLLLAADIGFHSWEEVNIIRRGANYGYGEREGTFVLNLPSGRAHDPLPAQDSTFDYTYPVIQYPHDPALGYGDAIAGAFVYRGTRLPQLQGKLIFGDITTGHLFYADLAAVIAADDGNPATLAPFQRIEFLWDNPRNPAGWERFDRLYEIVADEYRARGGPLDRLPGAATVSDLTGGGRADVRLAMDNAGELYLLSKSDGMIRALTGTVIPTNAPIIAKAPLAQAIATGGTAVFAVEARDAAAYQWSHDGVTLPGANGALFTLMNATAAHAGNYTVDVSNAAGTTTSVPAPFTVTPTTAPGRMVNFSIRSNAGTGSQTLIVGLALEAAPSLTSPTLLLRGIGPTLANFGVLDALADPKVELFRTQTRLAENDNWEVSSGAAAIALQVGAFTLTPESKDAALVQTGLAAGAYTFQVTAASPTGATGVGGVALAEVFDATPLGAAARQMINVSARTLVGTGEEILIAGFTIGGTTARTLLIRAAGPVLNTFQVAGTLADPRLTLFRGTTAIAESDNWQSSPELVSIFSATGAFPFNARSRDAALLVTLPPGSYTAHVSGLGEGAAATGVALVEVYALP